MKASQLMTCHGSDDESADLVGVARLNDLNSLSCLLKGNGPVDFGSGEGKRILRWACESGRFDVMRLLVEHGAPLQLVL